MRRERSYAAEDGLLVSARERDAVPFRNELERGAEVSAEVDVRTGHRE